MSSLREVRGKIKSVRSTQQITGAMKMVAAARMRRAQTAILSSRPFAEKMSAMLRDLAGTEDARRHPLFVERPTGGACLVLVTADKGLCGAFNANALRGAIGWLRRHQGEEVFAAAAGRRGRDLLTRLSSPKVRVLAEVAGIFPKVSFAHAELLGKAVLEAYLDGRVRTVDLIYGGFKSAVQQSLEEVRLLPISVPAPETGTRSAFRFEPGREALLEALLPCFVKGQLYRALLESQAAELAARMSAMDAASKNAGELIEAMTLWLNRTRQALITREIAELVGGAEALAA